MKITIYRYTGRHALFYLPKGWCEECDLSIALARQVALEAPGTQVEVKSWFNRLWEILPRGGWHPPIVMVDGKLFSQGVVPEREALARAVRDALGARPQREPRHS